MTTVMRLTIAAAVGLLVGQIIGTLIADPIATRLVRAQQRRRAERRRAEAAVLHPEATIKPARSLETELRAVIVHPDLTLAFVFGDARETM
jgi:flagellar motor component MotA